MLIRELEQRTGLERATIRFYEREGFLKPDRGENGYRIYSEDDCAALQKIKLLRQLGMSLEQIRQLQQIPESFCDVLHSRISALEQQIQEAHRAKEICMQMYVDGVRFDNFDPEYYLSLLEKPRIPELVRHPVPEFSLHLQRPWHPFRRFFARRLDYTLVYTLCGFFCLVVLRLRPATMFMLLFISLLSLALHLPINAAWIHQFGCTPGKWLMGLRVESCNGCKLSFRKALEREWEVFRTGQGFMLPIFGVWRLWRSWKDYDSFPNMDWDLECDYYYEEWGWQRKTACVGAILLIAGILLGTSMDLSKPRHREEQLTVAQFAENYNDCVLVGADSIDHSRLLKEDGSWNQEDDTVIIYVDLGTAKIPEVQYTLEEGKIREIFWEGKWGFLGEGSAQSFPWVCQNLLESCVLARPGVYAQHLSGLYRDISMAMLAGERRIEFQDLMISWTLPSEGEYILFSITFL